MSLPDCQQRILDTIESALQKREPRLVSMFTMFTRLTTSEGLPRTERLEAAPWWAWRRRWRARHAGSPRARGPHGRPVALSRALLLIPLLITLVITAVYLGMSSAAHCMPADGPHGPVTSQSHFDSCPSASGSRFFGHAP